MGLLCKAGVVMGTATRTVGPVLQGSTAQAAMCKGA